MSEDRAFGIIGQIYDAALGDTDWAEPLSALADYCEAENAALVRVDHSLHSSSVVAPRADPAVTAAYNQEWWAHDPTVAATHAAPVGHITSLADTGRRRFLNSAFHNAFWRQSGLGAERLAVNLRVQDGGFASCVVQASARRDALDEQAAQRLARLTPHLIRAVEIQRGWQRLAISDAIAAQAASGENCLGMMIVDRSGRILHADAGGESLLMGRSGLRVKQGVLSLLDAPANDRLREAILRTDAKLFEGLSPIFFRAAEGGWMMVEVAPWSRAAEPINMFGTPPAAILIFRRPVGKPRGSAGSRENRSVRKAARQEILAVVKRDIQANIDHPDLSLHWLARRHGLTARRLRDLFYADNSNFTQYLLNLRLDRAQAMLTDPALAERTIAAIAMDAGFGDLSWFHHTFRRRFAMTPAEMRARDGLS